MKPTALVRYSLTGFMLMLGTILFFTVSTWRHPPLERSTLERIVEIQKDTTHHYVDQQDRTHGETRVAQADAATLQIVYPFIDSILRSLDATRKQLDALTAMSTVTSGTIRPKVEQVARGDKSMQHVSYKDKWLDLDEIISDTPSIKYSIYDSLLVSTYWKRKWLFGPKTTYLNVYSLNPASRVNNLTGLKVSAEKQKRFGIGPYVGYGYDGTQWRPSIGLSLQYSLIKF